MTLLKSFSGGPECAQTSRHGCVSRCRTSDGGDMKLMERLRHAFERNHADLG